MAKHRFYIALLTFFLLFFALFTLNFKEVQTEPTTIIVPVDYPTIQEAINNANEGDTIFVRIGTYYEVVVVNKTISLEGESLPYTIVDGGGMGNIFTVESDHVNISGFTIQNAVEESQAGIYLEDADYCNIHENEIRNNSHGIGLSNSFDCWIFDNSLVDNEVCGLRLGSSADNIVYHNNVSGSFNGVWLQWYSTRNIISGNRIYNNNRGVMLEENSYNNTVVGNTIIDNVEYGVSMFQSYYNDVALNQIISTGFSGISFIESRFNIVSANNISFNDFHGVMMEVSHNNTIAENTIEFNNVAGIILLISEGNVLTQNNITANSLYGIYCWNLSDYNRINRNNVLENQYGVHLGHSASNIFFHNNFINNTFVSPYFGAPGFINNWDAGYPVGGNYWAPRDQGLDVYSGAYQNEIGSDGIADNPFQFDIHNIDQYPLMGPLGPLTSTGTNVTVFPQDNVCLIYGTITSEGDTTFEMVGTGPDPPAGFKIGDQYFNIETTASYTGIITIRIIYDDYCLTLEEELSLTLLQWEDPPGNWVDITTHVDTENNVIYGETTHLSIFGVCSVLIHDIAAVEVFPSKTVVGQGNVVNIEVFVTNVGDYPETFNVSLKADGTVLTTFTDVLLEADSSTVMSHPWATDSLVYGYYLLSVNITEVDGETNVLDNSLTDGLIFVTIPGDVNGDQKVDLIDLYTCLILHYGCEDWMPCYVADYDINGDGKIDLLDIFVAIIHYGEEW